MANNYFQFKQFTVYQDNCAMKVCTDACLFGSLSPALTGNTLRILDIGTGTGLLSLMCAQQYHNATIEAVEIDDQAAQQASSNFTQSPWAQRLKVHHASIQQFAERGNTPYDYIISNPPFFDNDLKSADTKRNVALHSNALSLDELLLSVDALLKQDGILGLLLPCHRMEFFEKIAAAKSLYPFERILVRQTPASNYFRAISFFKRENSTPVEREIIIQDENRQYTQAFTQLLKEYYLYL